MMREECIHKYDLFIWRWMIITPYILLLLAIIITRHIKTDYTCSAILHPLMLSNWWFFCQGSEKKREADSFFKRRKCIYTKWTWISLLIQARKVNSPTHRWYDTWVKFKALTFDIGSNYILLGSFACSDNKTTAGQKTLFQSVDQSNSVNHLIHYCLD